MVNRGEGKVRVHMFVNRSVMFVEAVFKSTFGFFYVLFVTVVTLYHVDNVFGVAVNVMINKSSFASGTKCIRDWSKSIGGVGRSREGVGHQFLNPW